jgi:16S rRNA U516 pseudouridylate synthase RsuA-like enzyme
MLPQQPTQQQLQLLKAGTTIDGVRVIPKRVQLLQPPSVAAGSAPQGPARGSSSRNAGVRQSAEGRCVLCIEVSEGKKHEVRSGVRFYITKRNSAPDSIPAAGRQ